MAIYRAHTTLGSPDFFLEMATNCIFKSYFLKLKSKILLILESHYLVHMTLLITRLLSKRFSFKKCTEYWNAFDSSNLKLDKASCVKEELALNCIAASCSCLCQSTSTYSQQSLCDHILRPLMPLLLFPPWICHIFCIVGYIHIYNNIIIFFGEWGAIFHFKNCWNRHKLLIITKIWTFLNDDI